MSDIEWTDVTWNPTSGCTRVSAGCDNCYAVVMTRRLAAMGQEAKYGGLVNPGKKHFNGVVRTHDDALERPFSWKKPRKVFVNSMSDLFHRDVPVEFIDRVLVTVAMTRRHTYQVLTKRPERMAEYFAQLAPNGAPDPDRWDAARRPLYESLMRSGQTAQAERLGIMGAHPTWPLPNLWLGTSVEDQAAADERIPHLLRTPAAVRFLSCEPLLGPVDLTDIVVNDGRPREWHVDALQHLDVQVEDDPDFHGARIDWVIVGGESGPGARPCDVSWIRSIVVQCRAAWTPVFVKQTGRWVLGDHTGFRVSHWLFEHGTVFVPPLIGPGAHARPIGAIGFSCWDSKGGKPEEWAADLRIREFPT